MHKLKIVTANNLRMQLVITDILDRTNSHSFEESIGGTNLKTVAVNKLRM